MDEASSATDHLEQRNSDLKALLGMVERRSLTADQFHSACAILFDDQGSEQSFSALIAAVDEGRESMATLIAAVTLPDEFAWTADRVIIWMEDDEAHAAVNLREGRSMKVALTKQGLKADRFDDDHDAPVASLTRSYDELLPAPT